MGVVGVVLGVVVLDEQPVVLEPVVDAADVQVARVAKMEAVEAAARRVHFQPFFTKRRRESLQVPGYQPQQQHRVESAAKYRGRQGPGAGLDAAEGLERAPGQQVRPCRVGTEEDIAIATNGGFAQSADSPLMTEEEQTAKLRLVETVARYYWGNEL